MKYDPKEISVGRMFGILTSAVVPRPIAFASTIDSAGNVNLSPFSFFNAFGSNPPMMIFSSARRGRDNTTKHTYENVLEVPEVVINMVNYDMVQQMSLSSTEYDKGVNEFVKAGLEEVASEKIKPPRVGESPVSFECLVKQVIETGDQGGAGNLILCEVVMVHIKDEILDEEGKIDPFKLDAVARLGNSWYCRASGEALFEVPKPISTMGIGIDQLPEKVRTSDILTGNDLGLLGNVEEIPTLDLDTATKNRITKILSLEERTKRTKELHSHAHKLLSEGKVQDAWQTLLLDEN